MKLFIYYQANNDMGQLRSMEESDVAKSGRFNNNISGFCNIGCMCILFLYILVVHFTLCHSNPIS